jgi:protocatechuate 3,4-dioxygenase beta subunit
MRRWRIIALVAGLLTLLAAAWFALRSSPDVSIRDEVETPLAEVLTTQLAPVDGAPCHIDGLIHDAVAARVRVHSKRARIDVDARLLRNGRAYSADVPEQGDLHIVGMADDGRTTTVRSSCSGDGRVQVDLRFPPPDPLAATIEGRCIYLETGAPVPEATVRGSLARAHNRIGELLWSGLTDEEGRFLLAVPPGPFAVQCGKDGDDGEPVRVVLAPKARETVELFVEARAAVAGIVVRDGAPVPGVQISARNGGGSERARAVSDAEGRFVIRDLRPGAVVVEAHHEGGFAEAHALARVELPYAEVRLNLETSALGIWGVVRGDEGEVAGATVEVAASGRRSERAPIRRGTLTDAEGKFTIGGLVGGTYTVNARASGYTPSEVEVNVQGAVVSMAINLERACTTPLRVLPPEPKRAVMISVRPKEGESTEIAGETGQSLQATGPSGRALISVRTVGGAVRTASVSAVLCGPEIAISLPADDDAGAIEAFVRDREHAPVAGVRVWIERIGAGETGADGKVRFEGLAPGEYWVGTRDVEPVRTEVQPGMTAPVELEVGREQGKINGTVVASKAPVEGARIVASCSDSGWDRGREGASVVARSGADGSFGFEPEDGSVCSVRAEHDRFGRSALVTLRTNGPPAEISLLSPGSISGRVTDTESGAPVKEYSVTARSTGRASDLETRTVFVSDPAGQYRLEDVTPGPVSVTVTAEQGSAHQEIQLQPGEQKSGVDFTVFSAGTVKGRVLAPKPEPSDRSSARSLPPSSLSPVFNANVMVRAQGRARGRIITEADGRFSIKVPAGEQLRVFVRADGFYPWGSLPFDLSPDGPTDLGDIVLKPRGGAEEKEGGLGIMFAGDPRGIRVIRFTDDSPAREAGMEIGDLITAIDGAPAGREPLVNWVVNLRGPPGTPVVLEIERGTMPAFTVTVIRRSIGLDPVP